MVTLLIIIAVLALAAFLIWRHQSKAEQAKLKQQAQDGMKAAEAAVKNAATEVKTSVEDAAKKL